MSAPTVYIALQQFCETDPQPQQLLERAGLAVRRNTLGRRLRREEMAERLQDADAVLAGVEPYDASLLASLPQLRCISRCGVGTDSIDLDEARRHGIAVYTTPDEVVEPVAQLTVAMILALARHLPRHASESRSGQWVKHTGVLLSEWTIGLVGFGRIGQAVERYLRVFSPRVLVADPRVPSDRAGGPADRRGGEEVSRDADRATKAVPPSAQRCSLDALLSQADVVSLHAGRRPDEGPLIDARALGLMKPGSCLVNTARGFLVDETALLAALQAGRLAGAALDVFAAEPYAGPLAHLPNVLCTPHVATLTHASRAAMERRAAQQIVEHFSSSLSAQEARHG